MAIIEFVDRDIEAKKITKEKDPVKELIKRQKSNSLK